MTMGYGHCDIVLYGRCGETAMMELTYRDYELRNHKMTFSRPDRRFRRFMRKQNSRLIALRILDGHTGYTKFDGDMEIDWN